VLLFAVVNALDFAVASASLEIAMTYLTVHRSLHRALGIVSINVLLFVVIASLSVMDAPVLLLFAMYALAFFNEVNVFLFM
jgi:hypothetical protein